MSAKPVISTGPDAVVRHPMYAGALLIATPFAPNSLWAPALFAIAGFALCLLGEERFLADLFPGYRAYLRKDALPADLFYVVTRAFSRSNRIADRSKYLRFPGVTTPTP